MKKNGIVNGQERMEERYVNTDSDFLIETQCKWKKNALSVVMNKCKSYWQIKNVNNLNGSELKDERKGERDIKR